MRNRELGWKAWAIVGCSRRVLPLALILAAPFGVGAYYGIRAVRLGESRGWRVLLLHLALMVIALVMPISEALT